MDDTLHDVILGREVQVWEALRRGDAEADAAALAESFWGVYEDGFADKVAHLDQLAGGPSVLHYDMSEVRVRQVGSDHALICYRASFARPGRAPEAMWVSSLWAREGEGWVNLFSQDTPSV